MIPGAVLWLLSGVPVPAALDDSTVVTIARGACPDRCPQYTLSLYGSGRVEFEGERYVCANGRHLARADPFAVRNLVQRLIDGGYFDVQWTRGPVTTGQRRVITSLRHAGRARVVEHDHGDRGAPRYLARWEDAIDEAARTARWLPERRRNHPVCRLPDGSVEIVRE